MVFNLCLHYTQNKPDAEEVTQDVFVVIYNKIHTFKQDSSLKTWIYRITINKCLDFIRAKNRLKRFANVLSIFGVSDNEGLISISHFDHPGVDIENREALERIFSCINKLPERQKTALILKSIEGLHQKEIAQIMTLSEKAVESLLSRGRAGLHKMLSNSEGKG